MTMPPEKISIDESIERSGTDRAVIVGLAVYFLISVFLRITVSGTADMDETEHLIYTQALRLGYGSQLPLYAWLQHFSFTLFGVNLFALSILKYTLLFSTYICVLKIARKALNDHMGAAISVLSLFLIPQVAWESYRTLTNTVLATLMAAVTLLVILRLREKPAAINYLLLGIVAGLGMLSKYNYAIFLLAIIIAGVSTPSFRRCLLSVKSILSLGVMAAITAPPYFWIAANLDRATASSKKLNSLGDGTVLGDTALGFASLLAAWIGYFWPALIVYALLFLFFKPVRTPAHDEDIHQLLTRTLFVAFIICSFLVIFFKVTYFKERWMQPLIFFLPVYFMYYLNSRIDQKRFRALVVITLVPAILAMLTFSGNVLLASKTGRSTRLSPPYQAMAAHLLKEEFKGGNIITNDHRIGGNFRLTFKGSPILVHGMTEVSINKAVPTLVLWNADRSDLPPEHLTVYAEELLEVELDIAGVRYVEKPLLYWEGRTMKLGYIIIAAQ
jgi:4-amino-4-deoxy-L-arabinose transferase-like glycosyltransferase